MTVTPPISPALKASDRPGAILVRARQDLHLSQEQVANTLHLSVHQIQALEGDDYTNLPGPTYVRGYLKSYAQLLGLDPVVLLKAHSQLIAKPAVPDFSNIAPQKEITSQHHQVRFVTYMVAVVVIVLSVAWWQSRDTRTPDSLLTGGEAETAAVPAEVPPAVAILEDPTAAQPTDLPAAPAPATSTTGSMAIPAPTVAPAPQPAVAPKPQPAGPRARLVLYADQETWVDIRDARQGKLLYETVPAGKVLTLETVPPVNVFLGNAEGMRLDYNGRAVDVLRHKRGMVARFTLGESEASSAE